MDNSINHQFDSTNLPSSPSETSFVSGYDALLEDVQTPSHIRDFEDVAAHLVDKSTSLLSYLNTRKEDISIEQRERLEKTLADIAEYIEAIRQAIKNL